MYRGTAATLSRDVPFSVLFFPGYANLKKLLANEKGENSIPSLLIAGGAAGAIAAAAVTPTDVIKTRYVSVMFSSYTHEKVVIPPFSSLSSSGDKQLYFHTRCSLHVDLFTMKKKN